MPGRFSVIFSIDGATPEQFASILKLKSDYLKELTSLNTPTTENKDAILKKYVQKQDALLVKFNEENKKMDFQQRANNVVFSGSPYDGKTDFSKTSLILPKTDQSFCTPDTQQLSCATPDGRVYKIDSSVNGISRALIKTIESEKQSDQVLPSAGVSK